MNNLNIPEGFWQLPITEVYTDGEDIVFLGFPSTDEMDDDDPRAHNCDAMGCGSFGPHVLARYQWHHTMKNLMEKPEEKVEQYWTQFKRRWDR